MKSSQYKNKFNDWQVKKIGVIGPGIVGMPMAALLAHAKIKIGQTEPAKVVVIQRASVTSGWKVEAINSGKSVIGGIEPDLDKIVSESVADGLLYASHDYNELKDADVILVCVQTDKKGFEPDYGPLFDALTNVAIALSQKNNNTMPLIIFESTLAPSTMSTVIRELFARYNLIEGKDILLGNSPNRVMPGRLVERIITSDKIVAGLDPVTPELINEIYSNIVTKGTLHLTNSLTAEIVKTLENAYRDVRIAYSAEIVRYCDDHDIDYYKVRDAVNQKINQSDNASSNPNAVPTGGMLIPTIGVGGHCLPKDGILLWWRLIEKGIDINKSIILHSRKINEDSPRMSYQHAESKFESLKNKRIALLGAAYRFNSEDTRNSPTFVLAKILLANDNKIKIHDPFVKDDDQNLSKFNLHKYFTRDLNDAVKDADYIFVCTAHLNYLEQKDQIINASENLKGLYDGCNIYSYEEFKNSKIKYAGIGKGEKIPEDEFVDFVAQGFRFVEKGVANELQNIINFLNNTYSMDVFNKAVFRDVKRIAITCSTGCNIVDPAVIDSLPSYLNFISQLVKDAYDSSKQMANTV